MTDFTNHIGKTVEVMTKKGMAVGKLVFYGEHASKKKKSKGDLSKMRVGIHLQPEYHKRYGATNGVVSRHIYFGPLKKKHGILTVASNVRLCDIQPGDGFGEEDGGAGGAEAELTEEAQAAVEEQKAEKKRKKGTLRFQCRGCCLGLLPRIAWRRHAANLWHLSTHFSISGTTDSQPPRRPNGRQRRSWRRKKRRSTRASDAALSSGLSPPPKSRPSMLKRRPSSSPRCALSL
jgi:hypothetical protein